MVKVSAEVQDMFNSFLSINFLQHQAIQAQLKMAISKPQCSLREENGETLDEVKKGKEGNKGQTADLTPPVDHSS